MVWADRKRWGFGLEWLLDCWLEMQSENLRVISSAKTRENLWEPWWDFLKAGLLEIELAQRKATGSDLSSAAMMQGEKRA